MYIQGSMAEVVKRGPGRPPKSKPPVPVVPVLGVQAAPEKAGNRLEMVYDDPTVFKALFTYFRTMKTHDIHMRCAPTGITFFTRDNEKTSRVMAVLSGAQLNRYYCGEEFWVGLNRESYDKVFSTVVDGSYYKVSILCQADKPGNLFIIYHNHHLKKDVVHTMTTIVLPPDEELYEMERTILANQRELFPVEFVLGAKDFKKTITDMVALQYQEFEITKGGDEGPLCFTATSPSAKYDEAYSDYGAIFLRADIPKGGHFRARMTLAHLKPLAASMVTEDVRVLVREGDDILFQPALAAKALAVHTLTRTI